jgi:hypothetical protein
MPQSPIAEAREKGFTIRPYRDGDEIAINRRFNEVFNLDRPLEEWRRKFASGSKPPRAMLCFDAAGDLVAHYGATELELQVGEQRVETGHSVDSFAIRRRDVVLNSAFLRTGKAFFEHYCGPGGFPLMMGFPGTRAFRLGSTKLGYVGHPIEVWRKRPEPRGSIGALRGLISRHPPIRGIDTLWRRARHLYSPGVARDAAWVTKRYLSASGRFRLVGQSRGGKTCAWAAVAMGDGLIRIADLVWDGDDLDSLRRLLGKVARFQPDAEAMEIWTPSYGPLGSALERLGWTVAPHNGGCHVAARVFDRVNLDTGIPSEIVYALGDTDLI